MAGLSTRPSTAGAKIQPYFDVPPPGAEGLYFFRAQSEPTEDGGVILWIASSTHRALKERLGELNRAAVSAALLEAIAEGKIPFSASDLDADLAQPLEITVEAHTQALASLEPVSDEHLAQLLLKSLM